ncbi:hypothetical protein K6119_14690 [Paracrocinitomix mangrovi]|uniref:hypothetical protein n=1 Tax=Paracrocinitomix mangrovi TaxID=2862509 RepID=UPI001C8ED5D7|nr:hypothetical protein [Paracrocinitomix mangrovi]UKN00980.1 hypothetical protein K6119_14690 [Paracrocinitomix mangrovi]
MDFSGSLNKRIQQFALFILIIAVVWQIASEFDLTSAYDFETQKTNYFKLVFFRLFWSLPPLAILFFANTKGDSKKPMQIAGLIYLSFTAILITISALGNNSEFSMEVYSLMEIITYVLTFGSFGYLKLGQKGLWLALFALVFSGTFISSQSYEYVSKLDDLLGEIGLNNRNMFSDRTMFFYVLAIFNATKYILMFYVFIVLMDYLKNSKLQSLHFTSLILNNERLDKLSFSLIFWAFRIYIMSALFQDQPYYTYQFDIHQSILIELHRILSIALTYYIVIAVYRNLLLKEFVLEGKQTGWNFIGLNFPVVNLVAWIIKITKTEQKVEPKDTEILDENIQGFDANDYQSKLASGIKEFYKSSKNQGVKITMVILVILTLIYPLFIAMEYGNSTAIAIILLIYAIYFALLAYLFADHRAALVLSIVITFIGILVFYFAPRELSERGILTIIINMVLYLSVFHFDKFKFFIEKDGELTEIETQDETVNRENAGRLKDV